MPHLKKLISSFLFIVLILSIHLSVSAISIDNIAHACIYTKNNQSYLILHELLYHPTSGSFNQGNTSSQGYNTSRLSVIDIEKGILITQRLMGNKDENEAFLVLGCSEDNLWLYSKKFKSGLQSLNPITLENAISQATIYKSVNISIGQFIEPEWDKIDKVYGFDPIQQKLIITNTSGKQYYIDVETFATQPLNEPINLPMSGSKYYKESAQLRDTIWKLDGYDYLNLSKGKLVVPEPTFLFGKFLMEQNRCDLFKHFNALHNDALARVPSTVKSEQQLTLAAKNIDALISGKSADDVVLGTDTESFYIVSKSDKNPEATLTITQLKMDTDGVINALWTVAIKGMFYNVAQARDSKVFKQYFGDKVPESNFHFYQLVGNKLIVVYLLQTCCIDTETGKIIWQLRLK